METGKQYIRHPAYKGEDPLLWKYVYTWDSEKHLKDFFEMVTGVEERIIERGDLHYDDEGKPIVKKDADGNIVYKRDAYGNILQNTWDEDLQEWVYEELVEYEKDPDIVETVEIKEMVMDIVSGHGYFFENFNTPFLDRG